MIPATTTINEASRRGAGDAEAALVEIGTVGEH